MLLTLEVTKIHFDIIDIFLSKSLTTAINLITNLFHVAQSIFGNKSVFFCIIINMHTKKINKKGSSCIFKNLEDTEKQKIKKAKKKKHQKTKRRKKNKQTKQKNKNNKLQTRQTNKHTIWHKQTRTKKFNFNKIKHTDTSKQTKKDKKMIK